MRHRVSMPHPHGHLFHVEFSVPRPGDALTVGLPVWTPGSYLVREYARHLEGLTAADGAGRELPVERLDKHRFRVASRGAEEVTIRYRVYAHELTVRTCHLDGTHGYFNGAALLLYAEGRERDAQELEVVPPDGWRVATALDPAPGARDPFGAAAGGEGWRFTARDYDELVDSPVEVGTHALVRFEAAGRPHALALWGRAAGGLDPDRLAREAARLVEHFARQMGGLPYRRYLFIVHLHPTLRGGLEHAASTTLLVKRGGFFPKDAYQDTLALVAHEFFHVWNVKGLRPAALVPYDYRREQYTRLLWWFEGVTSYYDELTVVRAGLGAAKRYLEHLGEELTALARQPGAAKMSLEEASFTAWVKYYRPDENSPNSAVSYYQKGELVALQLDLALRRAGGSLDELVRALVERHGARGLPEDGVERAVAERLGADAARAFFDRYVRGTAPLELDLAQLGLAVRRRRAQGWDDKGGTPAKPDERPAPGWLGAAIPEGPKLKVASVREGGPAWKAGLYADDEIVAEDGLRVDRAALWNRLCERGPGGALRLTVFRRDELLEVEVPLGEAPEDTLWLEPAAGAGPAERAAFEAWCGAPFPTRPA
ncbi:M61 family metallopeptidase [Anaeromyxobacter diazotrophicus]|uniref:Peptidase M61 n=1 Tax=Anaeromyxobacter diazotrophicus TaxID=2590199 RepID=A0A7I9VHQ9_9BACT|nr:PDZ domain-containing protein [Anaeromyxobacter diazotrophicus]GEJ55943.1 peptidase M61 [Anaeromyxobacter diazotrophicus]